MTVHSILQSLPRYYLNDLNYLQKCFWTAGLLAARKPNGANMCFLFFIWLTTEQNNHLFKNVTFSRVSFNQKKRLISWNGQEEATATWRSNLMRIALDSICHKCHCNIVTWLSDGFPGLPFFLLFKIHRNSVSHIFSIILVNFPNHTK